MKKSTILVVDDNPVALDSMEGILKGQGYNLFFSSNGPEALKIATDMRPDLILLDIMMPGMDGFEVCRRIRKDPVLSEVPIVMVTALDDLDSLIEGIAAGADDFISKPYNIAELRIRVKTITKLNRYRRLLHEREKFRWVVEQANDGYIILNDKEEIIYANPRAKHYLSISDDTDITQTGSFIESAKKDYYFKSREAWESWPRKIKTQRFLLRPATDYASAFWLRVELIEMSAGLEGYLVRLQDVTQKIISRDTIWKFHNLLTHKLITPLASLKCILDLLNMDPSLFSPDEETQALIRDARRSAECINRQLNNILLSINSREIMRPEQGKTSIAGIINIIEEINTSLELKSINISCEKMEAPEKVFISFSLPAMEMVLGELFLNAKKFHPEKSPEIEVNIVSVADGIRIQVCDNGISLSPEQLLNMWQSYYQEEKDFILETSGLGLGLSTIASMIWSSKGFCKSYNRTDGPGIIIEIVLPLAA